MEDINRLIILTTVFNLLILIGAGHGIGFLGLIEIVGFKEVFQGNIKFSLIGSYDDRLFSSGVVAFVGQIILTIAFFQKQQIQKFKIVYVGIFTLLFSFIILTMDISNSTLDSFSFWSGTPFLVLAILLLVRTIKNHKLILD